MTNPERKRPNTDEVINHLNKKVRTSVEKTSSKFKHALDKYEKEKLSEYNLLSFLYV
ncbi:hypothetical protein ACOI1C_06245 [Bacillus sp. DJP31]|uniref:hypothetical protein n=1 Tax=Bacillus sp. DJP31 TaxID=3409789 RepID=UPI003BB5F8B6